MTTPQVFKRKTDGLIDFGYSALSWRPGSGLWICPPGLYLLLHSTTEKENIFL
jgi:hypothetical protein